MYRILFMAALLVAPQLLSAQPWTGGRPDGHAPIGVMGDHTHGAGEFMISYRFMHMAMAGSRDGSTTVADADVVDPNGYGFLITPTEMPMQMHMLGLMYAPTSDLTLMAMVPAVTSSMDHMMRSGMTFTTESSGLGDASLTALYTIARPERQRIHVNFGVSFPTGSIEQMDQTPMSGDGEALLPYPMQTGSGSFGVRPGITYLGQSDALSWGAQMNSTFFVNDNSSDYRLGNRQGVTAWIAKNLNRTASVSLRGNFQSTGDISGENPAYAMAVQNNMVPTVFPNLRAGQRFDVGAGINVSIPNGVLKGLRFAVEGTMPVYQSLDGPQLETDFTIMGGFQYAPPR